MSRELQQLPCGIEVYPAHTWMDWMYLVLYTLGRVMAWALGETPARKEEPRMTTNRYLYRETAEGFPLYRRVRGEGLAFVRFFRTREEARREVYRLNGWKMRGAPG